MVKARVILLVVVVALSLQLFNGINAQQQLNYTTPIVLGQSSLSLKEPGFPPNAASLHSPTSISYSQNQLFVCDSLNARLLVFPSSSFQTGAPATISPTNINLNTSGAYVVQWVRTFTYFTDQYAWVTRQPGSGVAFEQFYYPYVFNQSLNATISSSLYSSTLGSVVVDTNTGDLYTVDSGFSRILKYSFYNTSYPSAIYGQTGYSTATPNTQANKGGLPDATTLNNPTCAIVGCSGDLWVSDTHNNRILHFPSGSSTADIVIGQQNFTSGDVPSSATASTLYYPGGLALNRDCTLLFVADTGFNRVLRYRYPFATGQAAQAVFTGATDIGNLFNPLDVAVDEDSNILWIADSYNNRVVGLSTSFIPDSLSPTISASSSASVSPLASSSGPSVNSASTTVSPPASLSVSPTSAVSQSSIVTISPSAGSSSSSVNSASLSTSVSATTLSATQSPASASVNGSPATNSSSNSDGTNGSGTGTSTTTGGAAGLHGFIHYFL